MGEAGHAEVEAALNGYRGAREAAAAAVAELKPELADGTPEPLSRALEVFLEPVNTTVLEKVPRQRPFVDVLDEHCKSWAAYIRQGGEDAARRRHPVSMVSAPARWA